MISRKELQICYEFLAPTPINQGLMAFGFECDDGWLPILETLFEGIDMVIKAQKLEDFKVTQVKEKFGGLRVYTNYSTDLIDMLIDGAEARASITCEICGELNAKNKSVNGWFKTVCDKHYKQAKKGGSWSSLRS